MTWQDKAHKIIGTLSRESYEKENRLPNGRFRKKHRPYSIPATAKALVEALGRNDEEGAKAIMMYDYDANRASF
jgi:hypothetical protein